VMRPFKLSDMPIYQSWFSDQKTQRWVLRPDDCWWAHVCSSGRSACWALEYAGVLGGVLQVVFYMYMVSKADQLRPFVIFVIEENGAKVVANILLDKFVEGRHCAFETGRWKCPDFR